MANALSTLKSSILGQSIVKIVSFIIIAVTTAVVTSLVKGEKAEISDAILSKMSTLDIFIFVTVAVIFLIIAIDWSFSQQKKRLEKLQEERKVKDEAILSFFTLLTHQLMSSIKLHHAMNEQALEATIESINKMPLIIYKIENKKATKAQDSILKENIETVIQKELASLKTAFGKLDTDISQ